MSGSWVLVILILISSLPVIAVYVWFKLAKYQFSLYWFLFALLAGAAAFFPALILQEMLIFTFRSGRAAMFFQYFVRIALTEELSRLLILIVFFWISARISPNNKPLSINGIKKAAATGLIAGLGFSLLETLRYAASDISILPLRLILTAAVHAACGSRIGTAAVLLRSNPIQAFMRILTATAIHGIYNLMLAMPGFSPIAAILIAISAFFTAIMTIRGGWSGDTANSSVTVQAAATLDKNGENS